MSIQRFEEAYNAELEEGKVSPDTQFSYAWCLIRGDNKSDILKGVLLLQGNQSLCQNRTYHTLEQFQHQMKKVTLRLLPSKIFKEPRRPEAES